MGGFFCLFISDELAKNNEEYHTEPILRILRNRLLLKKDRPEKDYGNLL